MLQLSWAPAAATEEGDMQDRFRCDVRVRADSWTHLAFHIYVKGGGGGGLDNEEGGEETRKRMLFQFEQVSVGLLFLCGDDKVARLFIWRRN